jgi:hypothetical protein
MRLVRPDNLFLTLEGETKMYSNVRRQKKNERFLLGRAIMSVVEVLNKDAAVAFVTGD